MATIPINESEFEEKVVKSQSPVLVDFWATWCGPCRMAEPVLEELSNEYQGKVMVAKIDVDKNPSISEKYGVMSIPTTILFKAGQEVGRQVGFAGKSHFEELMKKGL